MASAYTLFLFLIILAGISGTTWEWWDWWSEDDWEDWTYVYKRHGVIDAMSEYVVPKTQLTIRYGGNIVYPGDTVSMGAILFPPDVQWQCNEDMVYELILFCLDTPLASKGNQLVMWRIDQIVNCDLSTGRVVAIYNPPKPGLKPIRFVLLMFESYYHPPGILDAAIEGTVGILDVSGREFIQEHGRPYAGIFFQGQSLVFDGDDSESVLSNVKHGLF